MRFPTSLARRRWLYALPALALAMPTIPAVVLLPGYYAGSMGLGLGLVGALFLTARLFDGLTDPLIGLVSDRLMGRLGRRKPLIALGAPIAGLGLVMLFQPPREVGGGYLLLWSLVLYLGWTLVAVPHAALGAELSPDYDERARITGARESLGVIGMLLAGALPLATGLLGWGEAEGLAAVAWGTVLLGLLTLPPLLLFLPDRPPLFRARSRISVTSIRSALANGAFRRLLVAWLVNGLATGLPASLLPLYTAHVLQAETAARDGLILLYFLCAIACVPLWLALSRRVGKHRAWCLAMGAAVLAFAWAPLLGPGDLLAFGVICAVTGAALGADLALPPAMQADVVDWDALKSGERRAGLFFAAWSMAQKLALALSVGLGFGLLELAGFTAEAEANSAGALLALALIYAALPAVFKVIAMALVWGHPITANRQRAIRARLERQGL